MKDAFRLAGSAFVLIFVVLFPIEAKNAVLQAMSAWAFSFVPALMPVFIVSGALMSDQARRVYRALFGKLSEKLFGISGPAFAACAVGLLAGSPSGASCLSRIDCERGELSRAGIMASGLSPAFLSAGVGGLLNSPSTGLKLALCQLLAILSAGRLLKSAWKDETDAVKAKPCPETLIGGMGKAALDLAGVLCWMALFSLVAAVPGRINAELGKALLPLLEIAAGAARIAGAELPLAVKGLLAAFFCGLGGLCVTLQNASRLKDVPLKRLALGKLLHATLTALYFQALTGAPSVNGVINHSPVPAMAITIAVFAAGEFMERRRGGCL